ADGFRDTLASLRSARVQPVGGGEAIAAACEPVLLTRRKTRVAFLAISDILPPFSAAGRATPGIAPARSTAARPHFEQAIAAQMRELHTRAEFVLVSIHWGKERWT